MPNNPSNRPDVVVVGSSNTDLVVRSKNLPQPGQTVQGGHFQILAGGKGANQAVAAARAGARVTFVANIGKDPFGDRAIAGLRQENIVTRYIVRHPEKPSGTALILVDAQGENLISVADSSNQALNEAHIDAALPAIRRARCLVVQLEIPMPAVHRAVALAHHHQVPVVLNPAPARHLSLSLLKKVTWLTPNQSELAILTRRKVSRTPDIQPAARVLFARGVKNLLVTWGKHGVCWCRPAGQQWFRPPKVKAVDTTGAGDCFTGSFGAALAEGQSPEAAIAFAVKAAGLSVTRPGARTGMPWHHEIKPH